MYMYVYLSTLLDYILNRFLFFLFLLLNLFELPETWYYEHFLCLFASFKKKRFVFPISKSLWIKASAKWLNVNIKKG